MRTLTTCLMMLAAGLISLVGSVASAADDKPPATPPADAKMELFLLIGQSNMAGRGKVEAQDKKAHPRVWVLNKDDAWAPAVDPLHFDKPKVAGVGLGKSFGETIAEARGKDVQIGLIPCAVGGTSITKWNKGGELYENAIRRAKIAMKHGRLAGILWHQGESDSGTDERRAGYPAKLEELIANVRADLDAPDVPFVLGQLGPFHTKKNAGSAAMSQILLDFPKTHPNTACVETAGLTSNGDDTHFDAKSLREFGKRYAAAYLKLAGGAEAKPE